MAGTFGTIPHGSIVSFRVQDIVGVPNYLSVKQLDAKADGTGSCLTLRPWADHWEHFRVRHHDYDGSSCSAPGGTPVMSLQNMRGAFLSPTSETDPTWTFRGACLEWERLTAIEAEDGSFRIQSQAPWRPFLSVNSSDSTCSSSSSIDTAALLRIHIVKPPVINIRPLLTAARHEVLNLHPPTHGPLRTLIQTIGRAHRDVGFFHVIGHGAPMDALHIVQTSIGPLPYQHDVDWPDDRRKTNYVLADEHTVHTHDWFPPPLRHTTPTILEGGGHTMTGADPAPLHQSAIRACFSATTSLAEILLHALAHAQRLQEGDGSWVDQIHHHRQLAMRALVYHPGPLSEGSNAPFVTTAAHTDATWLTLLATDDEGLQAKDAENDRWVDVPAVPGALLVNTGNLLQERSGAADVA